MSRERPEFEYGAPAEAELRPFAELAMQSLSATMPTDPSAYDAWITRLRPVADIRVVRRGAEVAGGSVVFPWGQFFGGRSIPTGAISAVAVAPHHRGGGAAVSMMREVIRELRDKGIPLSTLYPASHALYRAVGYDFAGQHPSYRIPTSVLARRLADEERSIEVRPYAPADRAAIAKLYAEQAVHRDGYLDRGEWMWNRILDPPRARAFSYVATRDAAVVGYVVFTQKEEPTLRYEVHVSDLAARDRATFARLLSLLGSHSSMAPTVHFQGDPADPILYQLVQHDTLTTKSRIDWMLRLVDVQKAFALRGYPKGLRGELQLAITDPLIADNDGAFVLEVDGGEGRVRRGGQGKLRCDVGTLSTLFTGHMSGHVLRTLGRLESDDETLAMARAIFSGPAPAMPDMF